MVQQKLREHSPGYEQAKLLRGMAGANVGPITVTVIEAEH